MRASYLPGEAHCCGCRRTELGRSARRNPPDALAMGDVHLTTEAFHLQAPRITHLQ